MGLKSEMILDAKLIMRDGLSRIRPGIALDGNGYVADWRSNLLLGIDQGMIEADLDAGKGGELRGNFRAAHSSAALAVNAFGFFRDGKTAVPLPDVGDVRIEQIERTFPTGVAGRMPPHLDVAARGAGGVVAIESKCMEYFSPKVAEFAPVYRSLDKLSGTSWFREMERLREEPRSYEAVDAAQLVKHSDRHDFFGRHRAEIARFAERTRGDELRLVSLSYSELWEVWRNSGIDHLSEHADRLRHRYGGRLGSYEGYRRVDGRKTDTGFFGDLD